MHEEQMCDEPKKPIKKKQILQKCFHCGNEGLMNIVSTHDIRFGGDIFDDEGSWVGAPMEHFKWHLLSCPVCEMVTLRQEYDCEYEISSAGNYLITIDILYPHNKITYEGVPPEIKSTFESALKIKGINTSICVLSLRMTLEAICKNKKAKGKDLESKIKDLVSKNILPIGLDDACWVIRQLGNDAAHADAIVFNMNEVDQIIGFLDTIISYLYSLPIKIEKLKTKIENNKEIAKEKIKIQEETDNAHS